MIGYKGSCRGRCWRGSGCRCWCSPAGRPAASAAPRRAASEAASPAAAPAAPAVRAPTELSGPSPCRQTAALIQVLRTKRAFRPLHEAWKRVPRCTPHTSCHDTHASECPRSCQHEVPAQCGKHEWRTCRLVPMRSCSSAAGAPPSSRGGAHRRGLPGPPLPRVDTFSPTDASGARPGGREGLRTDAK